MLDQTGSFWVCTAAGSPGTWVQAGGAAEFTNPMTALGDEIYGGASGAATRLAGNTASTRKFLTQTGTGTVSAAPGWNTIAAGDVPQLADYAPAGLTGATAASRYAGATASGAPVSGTFAAGDFVIDQTGSAWICTAAGTPGTWVQGGSVLASGVTTRPPASHTLLGTLGSLAIGTAWQNTAGIDVLATVVIPVTSGTAGFLVAGVGSTSTPVQDQAIPATSAAEVVTLSYKVPAAWYLLISASGTIATGTPVTTVSA